MRQPRPSGRKPIRVPASALPAPTPVPETDAHLDAVCRTATSLFGTPFAFVALLEAERHRFLAWEGLACTTVPRAVTFCATALQGGPGVPMVVADARCDPRFHDNPLVTGAPHLRFYAGIPLALDLENQDATFCIADVQPRADFGPAQIRQLADLARFVGAHLQLLATQDRLRRAHDDRRTLERTLAKQAALARETGDLLRVTLEAMDQGLVMTDGDDHVRVHNRRAVALTGVPDALLRDGAPFAAVRAYQTARGEFTHLPERLKSWLERGERGTCVPDYERAGPDGRLLQVRTRPLDGGGLVRTYTDVTEQRAAERAIAASERRHRLLAENTTDIIVWSDLTTARRYVSPAVQAVLGFEPQDFATLRPLDCVHPDDREGYRATLESLTQGRVTHVVTSQRYRHRDGHWVWLEISFNLTYAPETGEADGYVAALRDVSGRKAAENALRRSEERLALALDSGEDGLFDWNVAADTAWVSERWLAKLGYDADPARRATDLWRRAVHPADRVPFVRRLRDHLAGRTALLEIESRQRRADGTDLWVLTRARVVGRGAGGRPLRLVGTLIDITQRKEAELRVAHMALHDALTGLPNRNLFRQDLDRALARAALTPNRGAVLACDLDRFKAVNDTFGHPAGDRLLCLVAARIRTALRREDRIARLGGDEFAVILNDIDGEAGAARVCERVIAAFSDPIPLDGAAIDIGISIGAALMSGNGADAEEIFKRADMALYQAKAAGRNTYRMFEAETHARSATRSMIALDMREAIRRGDFFLVYQPVTDVTSDAVVSFEALMRWRHPVHGLISPAEFIPMAEENGLIVRLGAWALVEACREAATWPDPLRVAVNVSAVQFSGDLEKAVSAALRAAGLPARRLELEVTESLLLHNPEQALAVLHRLRALGVRIALDDFGTGYSSLGYLRRFPFDKLKIDRSFIRDIADPDAAAIVRAVVGIGDRLGMGIVAEGVETGEQLERVRREGCTEVQGYLFSPPLPAPQARAFIENDRRRAAA